MRLGDTTNIRPYELLPVFGSLFRPIEIPSESVSVKQDLLGV
jgi:hypothetical protein